MLKLTTATYEAIRAHGEETYPHECCGVLLGRSAIGVDEVFANIVESAVRAGQHAYRFPSQPLQHRASRVGQNPARGARAAVGTSSASITPTPTIRPSGRPLISPKRIGSVALT